MHGQQDHARHGEGRTERSAQPVQGRPVHGQARGLRSDAAVVPDRPGQGWQAGHPERAHVLVPAVHRSDERVPEGALRAGAKARQQRPPELHDHAHEGERRRHARASRLLLSAPAGEPGHDRVHLHELPVHGERGHEPRRREHEPRRGFDGASPPEVRDDLDQLRRPAQAQRRRLRARPAHDQLHYPRRDDCRGGVLSKIIYFIEDT